MMRLIQPNELAKPSFKDTAVFRAPIWVYNSVIGRFLPGGAVEGADKAGEENDESDPAQLTPTTDSEEFELVEKSIDSLGQGKTTGAQQVAKANKRKGKKK